jgi:hypothetical protein
MELRECCEPWEEKCKELEAVIIKLRKKKVDTFENIIAKNKDLEDKVAHMDKVAQVLAKECANRSRYMSTPEEWKQWAEDKIREVE